MEATNVDVTFGPSAAGRAALSKASRRTLQAIYSHPIAHNLEWADVIALFRSVGTIDQKSHNKLTIGIGGAHHRVCKPHSKDITVDELLEFRRLLTQAGWSPDAAPEADAGDNASHDEPAVARTPPDLLVVVEHHEARIYHLDMQSAEPLDQVVRPYDPRHFRHHLTQRTCPVSGDSARPKTRVSTQASPRLWHRPTPSSWSAMVRATATLPIGWSSSSSFIIPIFFERSRERSWRTCPALRRHNFSAWDAGRYRQCRIRRRRRSSYSVTAMLVWWSARAIARMRSAS